MFFRSLIVMVVTAVSMIMIEFTLLEPTFCRAYPLSLSLSLFRHGHRDYEIIPPLLSITDFVVVPHIMLLSFWIYPTVFC